MGQALRAPWGKRVRASMCVCGAGGGGVCLIPGPSLNPLPTLEKVGMFLRDGLPCWEPPPRHAILSVSGHVHGL